MSGFFGIFDGLFAPVTRDEKATRAAKYLAASSYCARCGHRDSYHDGGGCRYDFGRGDCPCAGWMSEVAR